MASLIVCRDSRPDCFAIRDGRCRILTKCDWDERPHCPFYKTQATLDAEIEIVNERLRKLQAKDTEDEEGYPDD